MQKPHTQHFRTRQLGELPGRPDPRWRQQQWAVRRDAAPASSSGPRAETLLPPAAVGRAQRRCSRTAVRSLRSYSCASSGGTLPPLTHSEVILTAAMSPPHRSPAGRAFAPEWELPPLHPLHKAKNLPLFRNQTCPCSIGSNNRRWGWRGGGSKRTFVEARLEKVGNKNLTLILDFCL